MHTQKMNREYVVKPLSEQDVINQERVIKDLLIVNMHINFPDKKDFIGYVDTSYENIFTYVKNGSAILIGGFSDSVMLGFLWAHHREFLGEHRIHIGHIVVQESERSKGLGTKLINCLEGIAKTNGVKVIELITSSGNQDTLSFYEKKGFKITRVQLEKDII